MCVTGCKVSNMKLTMSREDFVQKHGDCVGLLSYKGQPEKIFLFSALYPTTKAGDSEESYLVVGWELSDEKKNNFFLWKPAKFSLDNISLRFIWPEVGYVNYFDGKFNYVVNIKRTNDARTYKNCYCASNIESSIPNLDELYILDLKQNRLSASPVIPAHNPLDAQFIKALYQKNYHNFSDSVDLITNKNYLSIAVSENLALSIFWWSDEICILYKDLVIGFVKKIDDIAIASLFYQCIFLREEISKTIPTIGINYED